MNDFLFNLGDWALLSTIPALALFVGFYFFGSPWRKNRVGRSLMYFALALFSIVIIVSLSVSFGTDYPGRVWVRLVCFTLVSITTWRLFFTLRHIQKNPPPDDQRLLLDDEEGE